MTHQAGHQLFVVDRNERATRALGDQILARKEMRHLDPAQIDADSRATRGEVRGDRRSEAINLWRGPRAGQLREPLDGATVRAFARAGLNRLPVDRVECGAEQRRNHGFADACVRSGDKKSASHARPLRNWIAAGIREPRRRGGERRRA